MTTSEKTQPAWSLNPPSSWEVRKFRYCFTESAEKNGSSPFGEMLSISGYRGVEVKEYDDESRRRTEEESFDYRVVRKGQLAVNTMWLNYGGLGVSNYDGHVSPAYRSYWIDSTLNKDFINYLLRSSIYVDGYTALLTGVRPNSLQMSRQDLLNFPVLVPPASDQATIATFLDHETAKIDALIAKQGRLIATLQENRTSTITRAVTLGVSGREVVDTDGNQLGVRSPVGWKRTQLKRLAVVQNGITLGKEPHGETAVTVPYLRVANVQVGRLDLELVKEIRVEPGDVSRFLLRPGDVLMTEGGDIDKLGRGCKWDGSISPCLHQNHIFAVRCSSSLNSDFLVYFLDAVPARNYFYLTAKKTTNLASTNSTTLGRLPIALPHIEEQSEIVKHLDRTTNKIDSLVLKSREIIQTLREYRAAVITNAVTGKIDTREMI